MSDHPGRACPIRYRYGASAIANAPEQEAGVLYVVGGLYGNVPALDAIDRMVAAERAPVTLCFNGDFNWFDIDDADFRAINERVLRHCAIVGNVEAELADGVPGAGCGCAYPDTVSDGVVERSNRIFERLNTTAARHPDIVRQLAGLPMVARFRVGEQRIGVVHGDDSALAGWNFDALALADPALEARHMKAFSDARVDIFASTHTCLPTLKTFASPEGLKAVINNGAAGMPNFRGQRVGLLTRIATKPAREGALYGAQVGSLHVEALPIAYDHEAWAARFLSQWPAQSDAHLSYFERIQNGPDFSLAQAFQASHQAAI